MVRELIFHLGDCKTGTTALQSVLSEGRAEFSGGRRYLYTAQFNHIPLAKTISRLAGEADQAQFRTPRWRQIAKELGESDADWGIVSAEHFEFVRPADLKAALDEFLPGWQGRTRFLAYVRPHGERIVSAYAEAVKKTGLAISMAEFSKVREKNGFFHFLPRFRDWRETFGEAFTLRPFVRDELAGRDVVSDALTWLAGAEQFRFTPGTLDNSALTVPDLAMMRAVHARVGRVLRETRDGAEEDKGDVKKARMQLGWNFAPILSAREGAGGEKLAIDRALATRVARVYAEDAAGLDAEFFAGMGAPMAGALARLGEKAVADPQSLEIGDYFSPREIGLIEAWADFTGRVMAADPAHFMWASKPPAERRDDYQPPPKAAKGKPGGRAPARPGPGPGTQPPAGLLRRAVRRLRRGLGR